MISLKPCPFCGGKARLMMTDEEGYEINDETYESTHDDGQTYEDWVGQMFAGYIVICDDCVAYMPGLNKEDTVGKWNKRVVE